MLEQLDLELNARGVHLAFVELRTRLQLLLHRYELFDQIDQQHVYVSLEAALAAIEEEGRAGEARRREEPWMSGAESDPADDACRGATNQAREPARRSAPKSFAVPPVWPSPPPARRSSDLSRCSVFASIGIQTRARAFRRLLGVQVESLAWEWRWAVLVAPTVCVTRRATSGVSRSPSSGSSWAGPILCGSFAGCGWAAEAKRRGQAGVAFGRAGSYPSSLGIDAMRCSGTAS